MIAGDAVLHVRKRCHLEADLINKAQLQALHNTTDGHIC